MNSLLLRACYDHKVGHFVFFSCSVMYQPRAQPWREEEWNPAEELHRNYFGSGWTKIYIEKMCEFFSRLGVTRHTVIRHTNVYGPHDKFDLERSHVFRRDGDQGDDQPNRQRHRVGHRARRRANLIHVDDLVRFVELCLERQREPYRMLHASSGRAIRIKDIVASVVAASGRDLRIEHDPAGPTIKTSFALDSRLAAEAIGWQPEGGVRGRRPPHDRMVAPGPWRGSTVKYRTLAGPAFASPRSASGDGASAGGRPATPRTATPTTAPRSPRCNRALGPGDHLFDTSSAYGNGHSEELIGQAFEGRRGSVVIATKAGYDAWDRAPRFLAGSDRGLGRAEPGAATDRLRRPVAASQRPPPLEAVRAVASGRLGGARGGWQGPGLGLFRQEPGEAVEVLVDLDAPVVQANFNMMDVGRSIAACSRRPGGEAPA